MERTFSLEKVFGAAGWKRELSAFSFSLSLCQFWFFFSNKQLKPEATESVGWGWVIDYRSALVGWGDSSGSPDGITHRAGWGENWQHIATNKIWANPQRLGFKCSKEGSSSGADSFLIWMQMLMYSMDFKSISQAQKGPRGWAQAVLELVGYFMGWTCIYLVSRISKINSIYLYNF